jgi:hypothetical protein
MPDYAEGRSDRCWRETTLQCAATREEKQSKQGSEARDLEIDWLECVSLDRDTQWPRHFRKDFSVDVQRDFRTAECYPLAPALLDGSRTFFAFSPGIEVIQPVLTLFMTHPENV